MPSYVPPKKNIAYILYVGLGSQANSSLIQSNPTIAAGDFKVSIDGGALANLTTLPTVTPASGKLVKISLSTSEMNGDNIMVVCSDAAGAEWADLVICIQTSARLVDDLAFPTTSGNSIDVTATGAVGVDWGNVENPNTSITLGGTSVGATALANYLRLSTAQAGAAGTITLDAGASAVDDFYKGTTVWITASTGIGQARRIVSYVGATKVATVQPNWVTNPSATSTFMILPDSHSMLTTNAIQAIWDALTSALTTVGSIGKLIVDNLNATISSRMATFTYTAPDNATITAINAKTTNLPASPAAVSDIPTAAVVADAVWDELTSGHTLVGSYGQSNAPIRAATAQAGAAGTITLDASASATDDIYNGSWIVITSSTGVGQARLIYDYVGSTKIASIAPGWVINPNATSIYMILPASYVLGALAITAGAITASSFAAGAIDAAAIATDAIGSAELASTAVTEIAQGVWDALMSSLTTSGSVGKLLADNLNATVSSRATQTSVDIIDDFLDTEIAAIKAKTDNLPVDPADASDIAALFSALNNVSVANILAGVIEGSLTLKDVLRLILAAETGKSTGGGTTSVAFRDNADTKNRIAATVNSNGNRTAVTLDAS